jgi:hypothetical protein
MVQVHGLVFEQGNIGEQQLADGPLHMRVDAACIPAGNLPDDQAPVAKVLGAALFPVRAF